jgi:hypothetical protein
MAATDPYPYAVDVHQHLWPAPLVDALRARNRPPMMRGWVLHTAQEAPYAVDPRHHDPACRALIDPSVGRIVLAPSAPLGIEDLPPAEASVLLDAWHDGVRDLGSPFAGWAAISSIDPDLDGLKMLLDDSALVGLQIPATLICDPAALERAAPVLRRCEELGKPVFVHPGPASGAGGAPDWWPAVVDYVAQLQAAWWAWFAVGRILLPRLRICFAGGAGLAPAHHERLQERGGGPFVIDRGVYVDTSSYGRQGVDALVRALGIDGVVLGSDRPYAEPADPGQGEAAWRQISRNNPVRLIEGTMT